MTYQRLAASSVTSNSAAPFKNKDKIVQAQSAQSQREVKNERFRGWSIDRMQKDPTVIKWQ